MPSPVLASKGHGLYFEEVQVGAACDTPGVLVSEEKIVRFAGEWDPQPFHLDRQAAAASVFGALCASGLQTLMLTYRLFMELKLFEGTALAGLGIDRLRLLAPVFAGDTIHVRVTVAEAQATSKPDRGLLKLRLTTLNQAGTEISDLLLPMLVKRRSLLEQALSP